MGTLGTFDSFTTARLGIYAAQHGLRVTGNNISNINTIGYTRQRIDQVSFKTGANDRYASMLDNHVGSGALVTGINQIRDPFLDIRYRNTNTDTSYFDTKLAGLQDIASILDEVGKGENDGDGLLLRELQDLADKLRALGDDPNVDNDTLVRGAAETIANMFNYYSKQLETLRTDGVKDFNNSINAVNEILTNIQNLNKSIRECEIHGDNALELRDERNLQIDKLSEYMSIKVEYSYEDVGAGIQVEKLTIYMGDANPDPNVETDSSMLVDGLYATQISVPEKKPVLNPYLVPSKDDLAANQKLEKLKGYLFLKEVDPANLPNGVDAADVVTIDWTDADGNPNTITVIGTNDPAEEGVLKEENDNYTIQLGKLLDVRGEEWKDTTTTWVEAQGGVIGTKAVYDIQITGSTGWADGDTFKVGNTEYTVGKDISAVDMNDATALAQFLAPKLNAENADYTVAANGDKLRFTAKNAGAVGPNNAPAPADVPNVSFTPNGAASNVVFGTASEEVAGKDSEPPTPPAGEKAYSVDPRTGTETSIIYKEMSGKWYKITAVTEHTREVALDDNDIYGKLQAQREFLTEEGEFASTKDIGIDESAAIKRGIRYYQQAFDLLAQNFAQSFNDLNQGYMVNKDGNYIDANGIEIMMRDANGNYAPVSKNGLTAAQAEDLINGGFILKDINGKDVLDKDGKQVPDVKAWLAEQKGGPLVDQNGNPVTDKDGNPVMVGTPVFMGGPLFSNSGDGNDTTGINASNISVSYDWSHKLIGVVPKFEKVFVDEDNSDGIDQTTQSTNINHMITLIEKGVTFRPQDLYQSDAADPGSLFTGSFNDMFSSMMATQAEDARVTNVKLSTSYTTLVQLDTSREGVSGVDLNDEAMNMVQYQKAMGAAMRLMTVIDTMLDRLINNTGVTV